MMRSDVDYGQYWEPFHEASGDLAETLSGIDWASGNHGPALLAAVAVFALLAFRGNTSSGGKASSGAKPSSGGLLRSPWLLVGAAAVVFVLFGGGL